MAARARFAGNESTFQSRNKLGNMPGSRAEVRFAALQGRLKTKEGGARRKGGRSEGEKEREIKRR